MGQAARKIVAGTLKNRWGTFISILRGHYDQQMGRVYKKGVELSGVFMAKANLFSFHSHRSQIMVF
jgi:hypothetical protein